MPSSTSARMARWNGCPANRLRCRRRAGRKRLIGDLPVVYPFIVNDPGEAAQAKRRIGAVTIGHLPPPLAQAAVPEGLRTLERLLDEYSTADGLDPARRQRLIAAIREEARIAGLEDDLGLAASVSAAESDPADRSLRLRSQGKPVRRRPAHLRAGARAARRSGQRCLMRSPAGALRRGRRARPIADAATCCRPAAICSRSIRARCRRRRRMRKA